VHDEQASLSPREAQVEIQGTGRRTDLLLSSLREDTRQTSAADGWRRGPVVAWSWLTALSTFRAECRFEAQAVARSPGVCRRLGRRALTRPPASSTFR
jgi:hypothetical protein